MRRLQSACCLLYAKPWSLRTWHHAQVEVRDVCYAYASRRAKPALNGVNLTLEPGKLTALVGLSGSGKSTLVALLERLYDPTQGQVRAAGR
jgi:ABC-type multidrug transport system fused ATPase/permease subunit